MIAIWDKATRQIIHQTTDDSLVANYQLYAQGKDKGFFFSPGGTVFPEPGRKLDVNGDYVWMTYAERVAAKLEPSLKANQKVVLADGKEEAISLSQEEQLKAGLITLLTIKATQKSVLYQEATFHLNTTLTTSGYAASDAAQKIALASIQMKALSDTDVDKKRLTEQGLLYPLDKAREILDYCAAVTASFRAACVAVDSAQNLSQVQSIKLVTFL